MDEDIDIKLREKQDNLTKVIIAIEALEKTVEWKDVKELLIDGLVEKTKAKILAEASMDEVDTSKVYRLQGELGWVKKYADLRKFASTLKAELQAVKNKLR